MRYLKTILLVLLSLTLGFFITLWIQSKETMQSAYFYTSNINEILLTDTTPEANKRLNNLLYIHLSEYVWARDNMPKMFMSQEDELICVSFLIEDKDIQEKYQRAITKEGLYEYILENTSFCRGR